MFVGLWGYAKFSNTSVELNRLVGREGIAKVIADQWPLKREAVLADLSGEFVCCILNDHLQEAVLAVDRMGTRPLYYQQSQQVLLFGSSADSIVMHPFGVSEVDPQGLYSYVFFHMIPGPDTIYLGQKRLLPGEYLIYRNGRIEVKKYWQVQFKEKEKRPFAELKEEFLALLHSSIRETVEGQKVGTFLSGGTDSSTIAGILSQVSGQPAKTYSIGFEAAGYDEMGYARIAAQHFATQHHEYYVTPEDVVAAIPQIASIFDQPFGNASAIPAFYCAQMAKADGLDKLLGGDGGDELFGGNERYAKQYIFSFYEKLPLVLREKFITPLTLKVPANIVPGIIRKMRSYVEQATVPMPERMETYNLLIRYHPENVFTGEFLASIDAAYPLTLLRKIYYQTHADSLVNRMLASDWKFTLADNDLPKVIKACELAGMNVAFPLLNSEMVDFSAHLEPQLKLKGTKLRYFFKEALRGFLPDEIIAKKKHGFGLPVGIWLQQHKTLQAQAADSLNDLRSRKIVRPDFIDKLLGQHLHEHPSYHGTMVWLLMMMEYWYKQRVSC
nr:asparagine synthase C-terminal domain-containing protein [Nitrosomonas nitrosa]